MEDASRLGNVYAMTAEKEVAGFYRGRLQEAIDFVLWAYTPFRMMGAADLYDLISTNAFTAEGLYLNLGYWKEAQTIDQACKAMAGLVAETAGMGPEDDVVDVGFGFAEQDILWAQRFRPRHILGLNVNRSQVRIARWRVRQRGLSDRIDLMEGSATDMPLPDGSCDIVTALECAFHFNTREKFHSEAFRVLRPGGRLVLADVIRSDRSTHSGTRKLQDYTWSKFAQKFAVPKDNADDRESYETKLRASGFGKVSVTSIAEHVFPGWHRAVGDDPELMRRLPFAGQLPYRLLRHVDADTVYGAFDYVLAAATKPK
jgi:ubiquinone/menaquinone biosynthesis C-methylase UbiE